MLQKEFMFRCTVLLMGACGLLCAEVSRLGVDFEDRDLSGWLLPSAGDWTIASEGRNHFLRLVKAGEIGAPRRPIQYAIRKDLCVSDFTLRVRVRRAGKSMLVVFGYDFRLEGQTSSECR